MTAVVLQMSVARAAHELEVLSEGFRDVEYQDVLAAVANVLGHMKAADAVAATRRFGLSVPRSRRQCIEAVSRAVMERKESWDRCQSIGRASPFTN